MTDLQHAFLQHLANPVIAALGHGDPAKAWFVEPNEQLGGDTPCDHLVHGDHDWTPLGPEAGRVSVAASRLGRV